ncbi:hypothetical protein BKA69DRAFT_1074968 [Paraphysoderma sedebokerense]|nr:hypothetical protein BKA69DRAFT_1074847 [Paraphysoderma sedebokerense]KAI9141316.1 hypothetical protein BKA69DRAFT_1074968 [Paraphysoderma sedebokerense]
MEALSSLRAKYDELKDRYIIDPNQSQKQKDGKKDGGNHPLALDETSPWNQWFSNIELRKTIEQDVERT